MKLPTRRITKAEWAAISEALAHRLAGEIEDTEHPRWVYLDAFDKVGERLQ